MEARSTTLERLKRERFDILILGGGINGAGLARDLTLRAARGAEGRLNVALLDQAHFASGTSGKNSQLIHGGLRYLKHLEFRLVREALRERAILLGAAPHLVEPLPFLMPFYSRAASFYHRAGLALYDLLAGERRLARHCPLSRQELLSLAPAMEPAGLAAGALFHDCRVHSARLVLENAVEAAGRGAACANYVRAGAWTRENHGWRVAARDELSGERFEIRARALADARGPWSGAAPRLVRGSHLVLPPIETTGHAIAHFDPSGRIVFVIPWGDGRDVTLVGTTDVDHANGPDAVRISPEEAAYLLGAVRRLFPDAGPPLAAFSSLRPLAAGGGGSPARATREHRIFRDRDGVVRILGGKYTTYRSMSEEAAALLLEDFPQVNRESPTAAAPLAGNSRAALDTLLGEAPALAAAHSVSESEVRAMVKLYGVRAPDLLAMLPREAPPGLTRLEAARIAFAVEHEMALRLSDLFFVSTYWGYGRRWDRSALEPYAAVMGSRLGWDRAATAREIAQVLDAIRLPEAA